MSHMAFSAKSKGLTLFHFWGDIFMNFGVPNLTPCFFFFIVDPLLFKSPHMGSFMFNSEWRYKEVKHHSILVNLKSNIKSDA